MLSLFLLISITIGLIDIITINGFRFPSRMTLRMAVTSPSRDSWQSNLDEILDVDTSCDTRREKALQIFSKASDVVNDIGIAIEKKDVKILAPSTLKYGKALNGFQAFQKQLVDDILPSILKNGLQIPPPSSPSDVIKIVNNAPKIIENVIEITRDPSMLQSTIDDIRREAKNVVKPIPEGLESLNFKVLSSNSQYEIRKYDSYSVCKTTGEQGLLSSGNSFNVLADYIFGDGNVDNKKLAMTTPVIMESGNMSFILSQGLTADTAPIPRNMSVSLRDIPSEILAYKEFSGIATEAEIERQRSFLQDALRMDNIMYNQDTLKVYQYNPPQTLPWLRTNAVSFQLVDYSDPTIISTPPATSTFPANDEAVTSDNTPKTEPENKSEFFSSPEAGD